MIVNETKHFYILLDNFPIVPGHILIAPKVHHSSIVDLNTELCNELCFIKNDVKKYLKSQLNINHCIFYEHGRVGSCMQFKYNGGCEHLHTHCLPIDNISIHDTLINIYTDSHYAGNILEIAQYLRNQDSSGYLLFEDDKTARIYAARQ